MTSYQCPSGHVVVFDDDVAPPGRLSIGSHGYAQIWNPETRRVELFHRWIMGCTKGDGVEVDHLNRDRMDCTRANLRVCTGTQNRQNFRRGRRNAYPTPYGKWVASVGHDHRKVHLGTFATQQEAESAATAYREAVGLPV